MTPVLIVLIVFGFVFSIIKMSMDYNLRMKELRRGPSSDDGSSMRLSELQEVIRRAVKEANAPLESRIRELESRVAPEDRQLGPASPHLEVEEDQA